MKITTRPRRVRVALAALAVPGAAFWLASGATAAEPPPVVTGPEVVMPPQEPLPVRNLRISKTAEIHYTRENHWSVDKSVSSKAGYDAKNNSVAANYTVAVTKDWTAKDVIVRGTITIKNPNPFTVPAIVTELAAAAEPLVYLGLGSSATRELALTAARQLGTLPVHVVAPIRHYLDPGDRVPGNVHVVDLVPAHKLGGLVDAAVLHGGQGTVQTACATGVPFVGMGLQPEQTWHVVLCERRGNAISLPPKKAGSPDFVAAVKRVLTDPGIRTAAGEVQRAYATEDGARVVARIIADNLAG